jgi:hypothetical protein
MIAVAKLSAISLMRKIAIEANFVKFADETLEAL